MHTFRRSFRQLTLIAVALLALASSALCAQQPGPESTVQLPNPQISGGMPLMQALARRQTTRSFRDQSIPLQTLSNLLWAAFGVNRPRSVKPGLGRTAPSAMNKQEVVLYVVLATGVFRYDAESQVLHQVASGDFRSRIGSGEASKAAVSIVYIADPKLDYAQVDVGFIGQNVYLFAASEGLNAWFYALHGQNDATAVAATLRLPPDRRPLYAQSVGYPPE